MFSNYDMQTKQMLTGNLMLVGCCIFYLAWWIIAFKPQGAVKGMRSGWLLIPAFIFGLAAVVQIVRGSNVSGELLFSRNAALIGGIAVYVILLAATAVFLKRQVTTELLLIVGWTVLVFLELNALYALGVFSKTAAVVFLAVTVLAAAIGIVCYLLYYNLDSVKGYADGMIPLVSAAAVMIAVTAGAVV